MDSKDFRKKYKICALNNLPIVDLVGEKCFDMIKIDDEFCFVGYDIVHPNCYYNDEWFISHFFIN